MSWVGGGGRRLNFGDSAWPEATAARGPVKAPGPRQGEDGMTHVSRCGEAQQYIKQGAAGEAKDRQSCIVEGSDETV